MAKKNQRPINKRYTSLIKKRTLSENKPYSNEISERCETHPKSSTGKISIW